MCKKKRLVETFVELVGIDSESKNEGRFHKHLKELFQKMDLTIVEDCSKDETGLGANNLIVSINGKKDVCPLFFSTHTQILLNPEKE